ncbi:hypothetical protein NU688_33085 [Variovorax sp. ZS18.2.2]|uniref:hypothetical protein n=1 Tax=Variovorax sp. ZS18.2.2 TaxID=2971255 RepID=UPI0021519BFC|nr:hypothetical protein [Variovorax sp. ZS18.2.2]MCR6481033.1 hypothetical protein [Variovorax sp. ZS18.2.2]
MNQQQAQGQGQSQANARTRAPEPQGSAHSMDATQWRHMMSRLNDPVVARLVLAYLDANPAQRDRYPGGYLQATETVKRAQIRYAKARDWGRLAAFVGRGTALLTLQSISRAGVAMQWCWCKCRQAAGSLAKRLRPESSKTMSKDTGETNSAGILQLHRCPVRQRRSDALLKQRARA